LPKDRKVEAIGYKPLPERIQPPKTLKLNQARDRLLKRRHRKEEPELLFRCPFSIDGCFAALGGSCYPGFLSAEYAGIQSDSLTQGVVAKCSAT
jgi:hypothetical protein